jgi:hypothetical protein
MTDIINPDALIFAIGFLFGMAAGAFLVRK